MKKIILLSLLLAGCGNTMDKPNEDIKEDIVEDNRDYLILVNKENPITNDDIPNELVSIELPNFRDVQVIDTVSDAYTEFFIDSPYEYFLFSGFRTIEYQEELYKNSGYNNNLVAKPYESEHHTGLAIDVSIPSIGLEEALGSTKEGIYLRDNIHKFGFIIRYEEGKKSITGYDYEPWHIRYVGVEHATYIYSNDLTLEEYLDKLI